MKNFAYGRPGVLFPCKIFVGKYDWSIPLEILLEDKANPLSLCVTDEEGILFKNPDADIKKMKKKSCRL